jgi:hypothetical protein
MKLYNVNSNVALPLHDWEFGKVINEITDRYAVSPSGNVSLPGSIDVTLPKQCIRARRGVPARAVLDFNRFGFTAREKLTSMIRGLCAESCQAIPLRVAGGDTAAKQAVYHYINFTTVADAINVSASNLAVLEHWPGETEVFASRNPDKLAVIDPDRVPLTSHAFITRYTLDLIVSDQFVQMFRAISKHSLLFERVTLRREDPLVRKKLLSSLKRRAKALKNAQEVGLAPVRQVANVTISKLERTLDISLPARAREYFMSDDPEEVNEQEMLDTADALEATLMMRADEELHWPQSLVCFASDGRGGYFALDTSKTKGQDCPVLYFDHELVHAAWTKKPYIKHLETAARTLNAWLKRVRRGEDGLPG